jgi:hypothetical protein
MEDYRAYAAANGVDTLQYLTDENGNSLNLTLGTNFGNMDDEQIDKALNALSTSKNDNKKLHEESAKKASEAKITSYTLMSSNEVVSGAVAAREANDEQGADEYSKALSIMAT